jgi:hypothetical protein
MSRTISVTCPNTEYCGKVNTFEESELISGLAIVDDNGEVVDAHPAVEVDENTFVQCSHCGYPISCADATISD